MISGHSVYYLIIHIHVFQEFRGHFFQSIFRPLSEPINSATVYQRWKHSAKINRRQERSFFIQRDLGTVNSFFDKSSLDLPKLHRVCICGFIGFVYLSQCLKIPKNVSFIWALLLLYVLPLFQLFNENIRFSQSQKIHSRNLLQLSRSAHSVS